MMINDVMGPDQTEDGNPGRWGYQKYCGDLRGSLRVYPAFYCASLIEQARATRTTVDGFKLYRPFTKTNYATSELSAAKSRKGWIAQMISNKTQGCRLLVATPLEDEFSSRIT